jgi:hypothetical protein
VIQSSCISSSIRRSILVRRWDLTHGLDSDCVGLLLALINCHLTPTVGDKIAFAPMIGSVSNLKSQAVSQLFCVGVVGLRLCAEMFSAA